MSLIVALMTDRDGRARVAAGARGAAAVRFCATVGDALAAALGPDVGMILVAPRDGAGVPTDGLIATLRHDRPAIPVIAYCAPALDATADIHAAARAGASALLFRGVDDVGMALRSALLSARDDCAAQRVLRELAGLVPDPVRPILEHCLGHARTPLTVHGVARALGVHRKTLVSRLAHAGLPGPRAVIGWSRLLIVAHALEDPGLPVERVALEFEFPSSTALRNILRRYTGLRPAEVRENGGLTCVLHLFRRALVARSPQGAGVPGPAR